MSLEFRCVDEAELGPKWESSFAAIWPAYRRWFLSEGEEKRPTYMQVVRRLRQYMPEFLPQYERMTDLAGGGDYASRFLGQYCPPPFFAACSQAILLEPEPVLVRNYDYSPLLCDGLIMKTRWDQRAVIAMTDCMSGVLDGMNENGLAISLAFGGRRVVGRGFGVPLVLRHILECADTVAEACEELQKVPIHVAYNIAIVDRHGGHATVMVSPDREPVITGNRVSTNHQDGDRWEKYARMIETDKRYAFLESVCHDGALTPDELIDHFLAPPMFRDSYAIGYGTLYTAAYFPRRNEVRYIWPGNTWVQNFGDFREGECKITFTDSDAGPGQMPVWPPVHVHPARLPQGFIAR